MLNLNIITTSILDKVSKPKIIVKCPAVFTGDQCQTCTCQNDGQCDQSGTCQCVSGFTGDLCQSPPVSPTCDLTCRNGGLCITDENNVDTCQVLLSAGHNKSDWVQVCASFHGSPLRDRSDWLFNGSMCKRQCLPSWAYLRCKLYACNFPAYQ